MMSRGSARSLRALKHHPNTAVQTAEFKLQLSMWIEMLRVPPATFHRPSVSYQSLLNLIGAVTGCHVPAVFSHISSSPIFCKGGQSKSLLPLTEAPFQDNEIGFFSPF